MAKPKPAPDLLADVGQLVGGAYLKTDDVKAGALTFAIENAEIETFEAKGDRKAERKLVLTLAGDPLKKLSLNQTNLQTLIDAWGKDARSWIGRVFDAYFDKTVRDPSGNKTGGLRVRARDMSQGAGPRQVSAGANGSESASADAGDPVPF